MATHGTRDFLAGVIEGFYGEPWTQTERLELFRWMSIWGLNTYLYAPKDDLKHRAAWRASYTPEEARALGDLIDACRRHGISFIYALAPGLDIRYGANGDRDLLRCRLDQMIELGCRKFALLFDDIPDHLDSADLAQWGSLAAAQAGVVNLLCRWAWERNPDMTFSFCPTPYCGRMAGRHLGGEDYLGTIGRELIPVIDVFWTGPEIISREITVAQVREMAGVFRRKPLIWDNLHANDYDGRRYFCGPYAGRPLSLRGEVRGLMSNPNSEFWLNYVPLRTLGAFVHAGEDWDERQAYLAAMQEWLATLATPGFPIALDDWVRLGDCFYLPHEEGPEAASLFERARRLLHSEPANWGQEAASFLQAAARLRGLCGQMAAIQKRPVWHALSRRLWDLREELDLLEKFIEFRSQPGNREKPFISDFHLPGTFRGGMVARLQTLLTQNADGTFLPASSAVVRAI